MSKTRKGIILNQIGKRIRELAAHLNVNESQVKKEIAQSLDVDVVRVRDWCNRPEMDPGIENIALMVLFFKKKGFKKKNDDIKMDDFVKNELEELAEDLDMTLPERKTA